MRLGGRRRSLAAWAALLAISLQALWPLLAHAKPRSVTLVPVCTVAGETHYIELETGGGTSTSHADHCKACPVGSAALSSSQPFNSPALEFQKVVSERQSSLAARPFHSHGRPRAPPFLLSVDSLDDKQERKDEEAVALRPRGARDASDGRGVLRRGILLD
jgi:hypothetical protein